MFLNEIAPAHVLSFQYNFEMNYWEINYHGMDNIRKRTIRYNVSKEAMDNMHDPMGFLAATVAKMKRLWYNQREREAQTGNLDFSNVEEAE